MLAIILLSVDLRKSLSLYISLYISSASSTDSESKNFIDLSALPILPQAFIFGTILNATSIESKTFPFKPSFSRITLIAGLSEFSMQARPFFIKSLVSPFSSIESPIVPIVTKSPYKSISSAKLLFPSSIATIALNATPTPAKFLNLLLQSSLKGSTTAKAFGIFVGGL